MYGTEWFYGQQLVAFHSYNTCVLELYLYGCRSNLGKHVVKEKCLHVFIQTMKRFFLLLNSKLPMILALWPYFSMHAFINNILADKLSRSQIRKFRAFAPGANTNLQEVPFSVSRVGLENLYISYYRRHWLRQHLIVVSQLFWK